MATPIIRSESQDTLYGTQAQTHADFFLKIDGIEGESQDSKHKNEIQLQSFSFGAIQPGSAAHGGGASVGKVQMSDFNATKFTDKSSPKLFQYCCAGTHIPNVMLTCRKAGGSQQEYLKITLKEVMVASFHGNGSGGNALPVEQFGLTFSSVSFEYHPQDDKGHVGGAITGGWNTKTNQKI